MSWDIAAGSSPKVATSIVMRIGRSLSVAPVMAAFRTFSPGTNLVYVFQHDHAGLHRDAKEGEETDSR